MDAFFASVEQLTRPTLRGRPVLVGGLGGRGVVAGASYEARSFGARSAMPMHQARRLVGATAVVLPPRGVVYGGGQPPGASTPSARWCRCSNSSPSTRRSANPPNWSAPTPTRSNSSARTCGPGCATETGLVASVGAGSGKQIAKIASGLAKPDGVRVVRREEERPLLDGLPVRRLWGIGPVAEERLHRLGIETVGPLAALADSEVADVLGGDASGPRLHRLARGIDDRPVAERAEAKQISAESTFPADLTTMEQLQRRQSARSPSTPTADC